MPMPVVQIQEDEPDILDLPELEDNSKWHNLTHQRYYNNLTKDNLCSKQFSNHNCKRKFQTR
jgi:hypothetical protein